MRIVLFCHSLISDWNHGNAHFLRGIVSELTARGHQCVTYEPEDSWSRTRLVGEAGQAAIARFHSAFPGLDVRVADLATLDLDEALDHADLVIVHEWNTHAVVRQVGEHRRTRGGYTLLFHDTHHRSVSETDAIGSYALEAYDGVLAFGEVIRQRYIARGWSQRAWTWHEAADTRRFRPFPEVGADRDLVWIGNWGDDERSAEIVDYLVRPVGDLHLTASVYGVRYPDAALARLAKAGIHYGGWLANHEAPRIYARHRMTVHIPRRPYVESLPGIPTIRMFEALACGVPLISAPWHDTERLFTAGDDYLVVDTPTGMRTAMKAVVNDTALRQSLATTGRATVLRRHTCAHRVDELLAIVAALGRAVPEESLSS